MRRYPKYLIRDVFLRIVDQASVVRDNDKLIMNGRCPVCGDSNKVKSKKRFYLYEIDDGQYNVHCHNGNCPLNTSKNISNFLSIYFPSEYEALNISCYDEIRSGNVFKSNKHEYKIEKKITNDVHEYLRKYFSLNCIKMLEEHEDPILEKYRKYAYFKMKKRGLSDSKIEKLFACYKGRYKYRVIIPFLDENNLYYNFQARCIKPERLLTEEDKNKKYIFAMFKDIELPHDKIYNKFQVDPSQTVYIAEGIIDSLFVKNCISLCGVGFSDANYNKICNQFPNRIWLIDNPYVDKAGLDTIERLLKLNEKCFVIPKEHIDCKDINDLALKLKIDFIKKDYINSNLIQGKTGICKLKISYLQTKSL